VEQMAISHVVPGQLRESKRHLLAIDDKIAPDNDNERMHALWNSSH
jgi:hypothetical protein